MKENSITEVPARIAVIVFITRLDFTFPTVGLAAAATDTDPDAIYAIPDQNITPLYITRSTYLE